jgi:ABC-type branched-subunit amino acid transport system permease subunit
MIGLTTSPIFTIVMIVGIVLLGLGASLWRIAYGSPTQRLGGIVSIIMLGVVAAVVISFAIAMQRIGGTNSFDPGQFQYNLPTTTPYPSFESPTSAPGISIGP